MAQELSIQEFSNRTKDFLFVVQNELTNINSRVAEGALTLIQLRVQESGLLGNGKSLGSYSTAQIPFVFWKGGKKLAPYSNSDAFSKGASDRLAAERKNGKKTLSYKEWRELNNLQTNHIDLKFTGDMWRDIGVVSSELKGDTAVTIVTAKNTITRKGGQKTEDIMFFNAEKFGDFMSVTPEEEQLLADAFDAELQLIIDKTFEK